jgi:hypothetical protein
MTSSFQIPAGAVREAVCRYRRRVRAALRVGGVLPESNPESRRIRSTEGGSFRDDGPDDGHTENVGLHLHQKVVGGGAAIHLQRLKMDIRVVRHRIEHIARLKADRLERGPRDMRLGMEPGQSDDHAARVGAPVGGEQTREGGHETEVPASATLAANGSISAADWMMPI